MNHLIKKLNLRTSKGLHVIKSSNFELFNVNLGVFIISLGESVNILTSDWSYDLIKDIVSTIEIEDIFEASFISILDNIVSKKNLLLSGPYLVFNSFDTIKVLPNKNYSIKKLVGDRKYLDEYSKFSNAININCNKESILYLLLSNDKVVAIASASKEDRKIYSLGIEVDKNYRNKGIGSYLLKHTVNDLIKNNLEGYFLVKVSNNNSIKLAYSTKLQFIGVTMFTI